MRASSGDGCDECGDGRLGGGVARTTYLVSITIERHPEYSVNARTPAGRTGIISITRKYFGGHSGKSIGVCFGKRLALSLLLLRAGAAAR